MNITHTHPVPQRTDDSEIAHLSRCRQAGFTLIEVLLVVAVSAVLLGLSAPSFSRLLHSTRVADASNALLTSMFLARSEAREAPAMASASSGVGPSSEHTDGSDTPPENGCNSRR